ncbi:MAG TPA: FCD domain-containing protein [Rhodoblastus sp.]|nr:FCD domain-containing protein [Rhodoblastus sp.]
MKQPRFDKDRRKDGETFASAAYGRLRAEIIAGAVPAGARLKVRQLCARYDMGVSPVREALNRLSRDGFVSQSDLHGFTVAPLGEAELLELTRTRCWLNERALRESIAAGDARWEEAILLAHHRLSRTRRWMDDDVSVNPEWEAAHRVFHSALIAACGSRWLIGYCEQLFDMADRYRHLSRTPAARSDRGPHEHRAIMEATLARDADRAASLLCEHFRKTADHSMPALKAASLSAAEKAGSRKKGSRTKGL